MSGEYILSFQGICKSFPGVQALEDITFSIRQGEILAIMGENGAGKSTLMKIAAGLYQQDSGNIMLRGKPITLPDAAKALRYGIGMVPQELNLVSEMNIAENILLGIEPRGLLGTVKTSELHERARGLLDALGLDLSTSEKVKNLTVAQQQMVQIARALANRAEILIMDEPTAALSHRETEHLFGNIRQLRERGTTILYISHRIPEVKSLADRIAVLRDGRLVNVSENADLSEDEITRNMIGRPWTEFLSERKQHSVNNRVVLEGRNLGDGKAFRGVSFLLHESEILGFAGLVGAGRSELFSSVFGFAPLKHGQVMVNGQPARIKSPVDAIRLGIGYVPEERKRQGLFLLLNVLQNISMPFVKRFQRALLLNLRSERDTADRLSRQLSVRTPSLNQEVRYLSGGNQQKVILARWLGSGAQILILDEPTRGIDVKAKSEIHALIAELAASGKSIVFISSDTQELLAIADRLVIMREGEIAGEVDPRRATEEDVLRIAMWGAATPPQAPRRDF